MPDKKPDSLDPLDSAKSPRSLATSRDKSRHLPLSRTLGVKGDAYFLVIAPSCRRLTLASDSSRWESASSKALASATASRPRAPYGLARIRRRLVLGPASVQECPLGKLVDKRTFRIMYLARIASRSFTFDCFGLGFRATCFDGDLHGTFHRIFEGHLDSEQSVLVGRFGFVRFHRPT